MPCTGEASMALAFSAERNAGHRRAFTEIMHPGGECKSAYKGVSHDLNSRLRLVAQMSRPRTCSKSFLLILLYWSNANSCSFSFRVLSGVSSIVSRLKLIDRPHQVRQF